MATIEGGHRTITLRAVEDLQRTGCAWAGDSPRAAGRSARCTILTVGRGTDDGAGALNLGCPTYYTTGGGLKARRDVC